MGITQICESIRKFFDGTRPPVQQIPRPLLVCSLLKRPGLSTIVSVANIVKDLNMLGIPTGPNPDGSPNLTVASTYAITKEIFRALRLDAVVQVGGGPMTWDIQVGNLKGTNVNSGGPMLNGAMF